MRSKILVYVIIAALTGLLLNTTTWADSPSLLVGTCVGCHGPGGSSVGPAIPSIAGMNKKIFIQAMEAYQSEERPSTIMGRLARGYTSTDFQLMAKYFEKQTIVRYSQQVDAKKAENGKKLHRKYCKKCHTKNGFSNKKGILAGQWMPYLRFSLVDFHAGVRKTKRGKMEKKLKKMVKYKGEESLEDIIHFYGSQTKQK